MVRGKWRVEADEFSYDISPDGLEVVLTANVDRTGVSPNLDVITLPACGCKPAKNLTAGNPADDDDPRYSPDGRYIAFRQQRITGFYADRSRLMLYERKGGQTRNLTESWDRSVSEPDCISGVMQYSLGKICRTCTVSVSQQITR